jgi:hypothetical protein
MHKSLSAPVSFLLALTALLILQCPTATAQDRSTPVVRDLALGQQIDPLLAGGLVTFAVLADGEFCDPPVCTGQPLGSHCDAKNPDCICQQEIHFRICDFL